jgi:hypothetical protein
MVFSSQKGTALFGKSENKKTAIAGGFSEMCLVTLMLLLRELSAFPPPLGWNR